MPPLDVRCSTACQARPAAAAKARWWQRLEALARDMTKGGRALVPADRAVLQHQLLHRSLPPPLLPMPGASERLRSFAPEVLTCIVLFDSQELWKVSHIVWKLSASCVRWTGCAEWRTMRARACLSCLPHRRRRAGRLRACLRPCRCARPRDRHAMSRIAL